MQSYAFINEMDTSNGLIDRYDYIHIFIDTYINVIYTSKHTFYIYIYIIVKQKHASSTRDPYAPYAWLDRRKQ